MDNYNRLLSLYRETKDEKYFNKLYKMCEKFKMKFINSNNFFYINEEEIYDEAFLKAVINYKMDSKVKFSTFLHHILSNELKTQLKTEYKLKEKYIDINRFSIDESDDEQDNVELLRDNEDIENDVINRIEYCRLLDFFMDQLYKYSEKHNKCIDIDFIVINRIINKKSFVDIAKEIRKSVNGTKANYYKFIKTFRIVYGRHYKKVI